MVVRVLNVSLFLKAIINQITAPTAVRKTRKKMLTIMKVSKISNI